MIAYLQIQNFILKDKDKKISNIIANDFKTFCNNKKIRVLNPLLDNFHNGVINDKKVYAINVFNEYLNTDKRLINLFNGSYSCTEVFFQALKKDPLIQNFVSINFDNIYNHLNYRNTILASEFKELKSIKDFTSSSYSQYLSFIEEFFINNEPYYYYYKVLELETIFDSFINYMSIQFEKDTNLSLDSSFIDELKHNKQIREDYKNLLFKDEIIGKLFNILNEETNNTIIFYRLKKKYYKKFLNKNYPHIDIKIIEDYKKSELFHNNMMVYLTKRN